MVVLQESGVNTVWRGELARVRFARVPVSFDF